MIRGSIVLLLAIGVSAIWGGSITSWLGSLAGDSSVETGPDKPRPAGGGTL